MWKIEQNSDGSTTILRLCGRMQADHIEEIQSLINANKGGRVILNMRDVTLVDVEAVRFLSRCESRGIALVRCPPYVREWIARERAEGLR